MAGPLSGISGSQVPFATTFQPGRDSGTNQVPQDQDNRQAANVSDSQRQDAPVSQTRPAETGAQRQEQSFSSNRSDDSQPSADTPRGSLVDELV